MLYSHIVLTGQQEQLYTQFMYNKLPLNPAFAGNYSNLSFTGIVRNQWIGFPGAPKTQLISINVPISDQKLGFGITATRNTIGITERQTIEGAYAYRFKTGLNSHLSIGLQTSVRRYSVDFTDQRLNAIDDIALDPAISPQSFNRNIVNFGGGIYFSTDQFYIGISSPRLSEADLDFDGSQGLTVEERIYYAMTGVEIEMNQDWSFSPQLLFKYSENAPWDIDLNLSWTYINKITGGINYRHGGDTNSFAESIDLVLGFQISESLLIGASYDFALSSIRSETSGSFEGVVHYIIGQNKRKQIEVNPRYF